MAEQTLALKLNGSEVRKALLDVIDRSLQRDWSMNGATAYDFFEGTITIKLSLHDAGKEYPLAVSASAVQGEEPDQAETQEIEIPINKLPPNVVRVDTGQEVPALVKQGDAPATVKGIRYKRGSAPKEV
jgi:hypothetical protein